MSEAYNSIKQGLEDALAHAKGKDVGARGFPRSLLSVPSDWPDHHAWTCIAGLSGAPASHGRHGAG